MASKFEIIGDSENLSKDVKNVIKYWEDIVINKETLQLEEEDNCFRDGIDIWKVADDEDDYGLPDETIERIIEHFSDDKRQLIGVMWYNK